MQRLLALNMFLSRRSAAAVAAADVGSGSFSYDGLLSPLKRRLHSFVSSPFPHASFLKLSSSGFYHRFLASHIMGRRAYVSVAGIRSHLTVGTRLLNFSFLQRKGFGACQPHRFWRSYWRNVPTSDEVVFGLIGANVAVFFLWQYADLFFMRRHFMISLENIKTGNLHTMLTCAFSHSEIDHLLMNMFGLYFFGTSISSLFGPTFLLKLYVAGALGGSVFFLLHRTYLESAQLFNRRADALGASAAVNAIILLDVFLFPKNIYYVNLVIPVPAILVGAFIIGSDLWRFKKGDEKVSGSAHMGGAFVALLAWVVVKKGWF